MGSNVTNDNNNFGRQNMGAEDWCPSSRVLQRPGGAQTLQLFGWDSDSPAKPKPKRDASRPRIIAGKIVMPAKLAEEEECDKENAGDATRTAAATGASAGKCEPSAPYATSSSPATKAASTAVLNKSKFDHEKIGCVIRGTEGYVPSGCGGLMSSSSELKGPQVVSRSSTRLHAPPGGSSSIVFG